MELEFKPVVAGDIDRLRPFYGLRPNKTCDSVFLDSFLWKDYYHVQCAVSEGRAVLWLMEKDGQVSTAMPLCREEDLPYFFQQMVDYFSGVQSSLFSQEIPSASSVDFNAIVENLNSGKDQSLTFQVDGEDYTVKLEGKNGVGNYKNTQAVIDAINSKLSREFGSGKVNFSTKKDPSNAVYDFVVVESSEHRINFTSDNINGGGAKAFGFAENQTNVLGKDTTWNDAGLIGEIKVNGGAAINILDNPTLETVAFRLQTAIGGNAKVEYKDGRFNITGLTNDVIIEGVDGNVTNPDGSVVKKNPVNMMFGKSTIEISHKSYRPLISKQVKNTDFLKGKLKITVGETTTDINVNTLGTSESFDNLLQELRNVTGGTVTYADNKIQIDGVELTIEGTDADGKALMNSLFGSDTISNHTPADITAGQNARLTVDGTVIERNSNTFELDGITME